MSFIPPPPPVSKGCRYNPIPFLVLPPSRHSSTFPFTKFWQNHTGTNPISIIFLATVFLPLLCSRIETLRWDFQGVTRCCCGTIGQPTPSSIIHPRAFVTWVENCRRIDREEVFEISRRMEKCSMRGMNFGLQNF